MNFMAAEHFGKFTEYKSPLTRETKEYGRVILGKAKDQSLHLLHFTPNASPQNLKEAFDNFKDAFEAVNPENYFIIPLGECFWDQEEFPEIGYSCPECGNLNYLDTKVIGLQAFIRLKILLEVATALAFLHSRDLVHGDIKLTNIFITNNNDARIGNFSSMQNEPDPPIKEQIDDIRDFGKLILKMMSPISDCYEDLVAAIEKSSLENFAIEDIVGALLDQNKLNLFSFSDLHQNVLKSIFRPPPPIKIAVNSAFFDHSPPSTSSKVPITQTEKDIIDSNSEYSDDPSTADYPNPLLDSLTPPNPFFNLCETEEQAHEQKLEQESDQELDQESDPELDQECESDAEQESDQELDQGSDQELDQESDQELDQECESDAERESDQELDQECESDAEQELIPQAFDRISKVENPFLQEFNHKFNKKGKHKQTPTTSSAKVHHQPLSQEQRIPKPNRNQSINPFLASPTQNFAAKPGSIISPGQNQFITNPDLNLASQMNQMASIVPNSNAVQFNLADSLLQMQILEQMKKVEELKILQSQRRLSMLQQQMLQTQNQIQMMQMQPIPQFQSPMFQSPQQGHMFQGQDPMFRFQDQFQNQFQN